MVKAILHSIDVSRFTSAVRLLRYYLFFPSFHLHLLYSPLALTLTLSHFFQYISLSFFLRWAIERALEGLSSLLVMPTGAGQWFAQLCFHALLPPSVPPSLSHSYSLFVSLSLCLSLPLFPSPFVSLSLSRSLARSTLSPCSLTTFLFMP